MKLACIIIPYFGTLRKSIVLFLEGCRRNPEINWLFFSDCSVPIDDLPKNVEWNKCELSYVEQLARKKLNRPVELKRPYKLCDLKPLYGVIFEEYLKDFLWWGYGDIDVIYGRIFPYMEKINYDSFDKISYTGHLSLIRNTEKCKWAFDIQSENSLDINKVLADGDNNYGFDEWSYNKKATAGGLSIYGGLWAADIDAYKRMRCVDKTTLTHIRIPFTEAPRNYVHQIFLIHDGHTFRYYLKKGKISFDEFAYIHFRKEVPVFLSNSKSESFIISRKGFFDVDKSLLDNKKFLKFIIKKYNAANIVDEKLRTLYFTRLNKSKIVRHVIHCLVKFKKSDKEG